jgi:hypothetical protein
MDMRAKLWKPGKRVDEVLLVADGMGRGKADAPDAIHFMHGVEQLDERRLPIDNREFVTAI